MIEKSEYAALIRRLLNKEGMRRPLKRLAHIHHYNTYGPLIGPKKEHDDQQHGHR